MDGFGEILASVGNTRQYGQAMINLGGPGGARWAYAQGGIVARIVDIPADMATSRGVTVEHGGDQLAAEMDRLKVMSCLADALRWSLLDGGGALLILARDGGALDTPLSDTALQQIEEFRVLSVVELRGDPDDTYDDPSKPNYGEPRTYLVRSRGRAATTSRAGGEYRVHESRIIPVPGGPMAAVAGVDLRDVPWAGRGLSGEALRAIERYRRSLRWAEKLLERSQQAVHKMEGLAEMLMAQQEVAVRARISLVDSNRSALNGVAVDGKDDYTITSASLSGVKDVIEQMQVAVSAETGYPVTLLFGRSPGGLNSTGDGDWALVYTYVEQLRSARLTPALERVISLIYAQASVEDKPDDWAIEWNPLAPLTRQQLADIENKEAATLKLTAEALDVAVGTGTVSQDEAHEYAQAEGLFGLAIEAGQGDAAAAARYARETQ